MPNNTEKIKTYIEEQESKTSVGKLDENLANLWLDVKISSRLKNDTKLLEYATLFLSEEKTIFTTFQLQFLELKASLTCPYFDDFKIFLEELKQWNNTNKPNETPEAIDDTHELFWTKVSEIESQPYHKNSTTWVTRCSATAQFNGLDFWLTLPTWDAYTAWAKIPTISAYTDTIPSWNQTEKPNANRPAISIDNFTPSDDSNFTDIYTSSQSGYGHRAVAFKDGLWNWYVLDPYTRVNWILDGSPKKLEDYMNQRKIIKANFYTASKYIAQERAYT